MSSRYGRAIEVALATRNTETGPDRFFRSYNRLTTIKDLRVQFEILKTIGKEPNTANITITNLAKDTRSEFATLPAHITLSAGYQGAPHVLFKGDVTHAPSHRDGPDWLTVVEAATGISALKHARINKSFGAGAQAKNMLKSIADSMGLKIPKDFTEGKELLTSIANGTALSGQSSRQLEKVLTPLGLGYSVQDDQLQLLRKGGALTAPAVRIAQDTGMIGSPELSPPDEKGKPPTVTAQCLLNPTIKAGGLITINSRYLLGNFVVQTLRLIGDTHGQPWYCHIEAQQI